MRVSPMNPEERDGVLAIHRDSPLASGRVKFHEKTINLLKGAMASGVAYDHAAMAAGIHPETFKKWRQLGKANLREAEIGDGEYDEEKLDKYGRLMLDLFQIEGLLNVKRFEKIEKLASGGQVIREKTYTRRDGSTVTEVDYHRPDWNGIAWLVGNRYPEHYGKQVIEQQGGEKTVRVIIERVDDWRGTGKTIEGDVIDGELLGSSSEAAAALPAPGATGGQEEHEAVQLPLGGETLA